MIYGEIMRMIARSIASQVIAHFDYIGLSCQVSLYLNFEVQD